MFDGLVLDVAQFLLEPVLRRVVALFTRHSEHAATDDGGASSGVVADGTVVSWTYWPWRIALLALVLAFVIPVIRNLYLVWKRVYYPHMGTEETQGHPRVELSEATRLVHSRELAKLIAV